MDANTLPEPLLAARTALAALGIPNEPRARALHLLAQVVNAPAANATASGDVEDPAANATAALQLEETSSAAASASNDAPKRQSLFGASSANTAMTPKRTHKMDVGAVSDDVYMVGKRKTSAAYVAPTMCKRPTLQPFTTPETSLVEKGLRETIFSLQASSGKMRASFDMTTEKLAAAKAEMKTLRDENLMKKTQMAAQKIYIENNQGLHDRSTQLIRDGLNKLRHVQEFQISSTRGAPMCPVSLEMLMPNEIVVSLKSDCDCNCMVKHNCHAAAIKRVGANNTLKCYQCNTAKVTSMTVSTCAQSELMFAWRFLERLTGCDSIGKIYGSRATKFEAEQVNQLAQNTVALRQEIESLKAAMALESGGAVVTETDKISSPPV
jgi:cell division protein FtsB